MDYFLSSRSLRRLAAALAVAALAASAAPSAYGATGSQLVSGVTTSTLAISIPSPAPVTGITPGGTVSGVGTVSVVSTLGAWTLGVADSNTGSNSGHLVAAGTGCSGSEAALLSPLTVTVSPVAGTATSTGAVTLSASSQLVANGSGSATLSSSYTQSIGPTEPLLTGYLYSLTAVYTLQV